jgi:hypothetical protein
VSPAPATRERGAAHAASAPPSPRLWLTHTLPPPHAHPQRPARRARLVARATGEPQLQKPVARPAAPAEPAAAAPPAAAADAATDAPTAGAAAAAAPPSGVTVEFQRQQAKAMQAYFRAKADEKVASAGPRFGWTARNEILNGRWVMMGFAIGLLTEYATGVSFINQIGLIVSNLGIIDLGD